MSSTGPPRTAWAIAYVFVTWKRDVRPALAKVYKATTLDEEPWSRPPTEDEVAVLRDQATRLRAFAKALDACADAEWPP